MLYIASAFFFLYIFVITLLKFLVKLLLIFAKLFYKINMFLFLQLKTVNFLHAKYYLFDY